MLFLEDTATAEYSDSKESLDSKETPLHEKTCTNKPIRCPECSNLIVLDEYYERESQMTRTENIATEGTNIISFRKV